MKRKRLLFLATAMVMASSMWAQDVYIETDLTKDFNSLATTQWQGASGQVGWAAPAVTTNSGLTVAAWENYCGDWNGGCTNTGEIMSTTVTGLVPGTYKIELYGAAAFTFDRNFGSEAFTGDITVGAGSIATSSTYKAGQSIDTETGVYLYATTSEGTYQQEIPIWYADNFNGSGLSTAVLNDVVVGDDGEIVIGMSKDSKSTNWHVVQLKGVTATVNVTKLLAKAVADANAITGIPTAAKNALDAVVAQNNKSWSSADEYTAAIEAIEAASDVANALVEPYAAWQTAKANAPGVLEEFVSGLDANVEAATTAEEINSAIEALNSKIAELEALQAVVEEYTVMKDYAQNLYDVAEYTENEDGAHDALGTAITNNSGTFTTPEEYTAATAALKAAATQYAADAEPDGEAKFDLTFMLTNPDVTEYWDGTWWIQPEGWYNEQSGGNFQVMANEDMGPGGEVFMEYWSENAATNGFVLCQKVTLPAGAYQMAGRVGVQQFDSHGSTTNVTFSANDVDGTQIPYGALSDGSIEFINDAEQEVRIGLKAHEGNNARWMGINNIHLYKIAPKPFVISENEDYDNTQSGAGDVELTRNFKEGVNTVVLPFQVTAEDIVTLGGEGAVAYTVTGIQGASIRLAQAESVLANVPFFLKIENLQNTNIFKFEGKTIVAGEPRVTVGEAQINGTYAAITVPQESYILSGGKFYLVNSEVSLKPTRAYITILEPEGEVEAKSLNIDIEEATAINAIESEIANAKVYDLSGRMIQNPTRGLYIVNGKKVLVK